MTDASLTEYTPGNREPSGGAMTFRTAFESEFGYVWHSLRRLGVREADLDDLCQDVFLTVHQLFDDYDATRPIRHWLFGIAYRYAARYRALAKNKREVYTDPSDTATERPAADEELAAFEARALVHAAIQDIEFSRRAVFVMADIDGCSVPEIAAVLAIPLNTAYSRLRLARRDFAGAVERQRRQRGPR